MDLAKQRIDPKLVEDGTWVELDEETAILVRASFSLKFDQSLAEHGRPYAGLIQAGGREALSRGLQRRITIETIADQILDWRGFVDSANGGGAIPFSREKAIEVLETCPRVREMIVDAMGRIENFQAAGREQDQKN